MLLMDAHYYTIHRINTAILQLSGPRAKMHEYTSESLVDLLSDVRDELMQYYRKEDAKRRFEEECG